MHVLVSNSHVVSNSKRQLRFIDLFASCRLRKCTALQCPCIASKQLHIAKFEHLMQRALALQTSVKLEVFAARVVILLVAVASLLLDSASQPLQEAAGFQYNDSLVYSNRETGSNAEVAGPEGPPASKGSQHLAPSNKAESSREVNFRGADHTGPRVCRTIELLQVLVPPADCCPAEDFLELAHGGHSKPACLAASSPLCNVCQDIAILSGVSAPCLILVSFLWRQQHFLMQLHLKHAAIASHAANVFLSLPPLTVQLKFSGQI